MGAHSCQRPLKTLENSFYRFSVSPNRSWAIWKNCLRLFLWNLFSWRQHVSTRRTNDGQISKCSISLTYIVVAFSRQAFSKTKYKIYWKTDDILISMLQCRLYLNKNYAFDLANKLYNMDGPIKHQWFSPFGSTYFTLYCVIRYYLQLLYWRVEVLLLSPVQWTAYFIRYGAVQTRTEDKLCLRLSQQAVRRWHCYQTSLISGKLKFFNLSHAKV